MLINDRVEINSKSQPYGVSDTVISTFTKTQTIYYCSVYRQGNLGTEGNLLKITQLGSVEQGANTGCLAPELTSLSHYYLLLRARIS